ncbi:amidohydrolase family protein [Flexistipes sp.]|uniref:amidohydrolase family protein n=1 Tax=Flexistipes sp. TaxID=3088135 RepID=UPI002E1D9689|nr:amidohydrolase family protein [Flexistipes sp.]
MIKAYYADYIYYDGKLHENKYILVEDEKIIGLRDKINNPDETPIKSFPNSAIFPGLINTHTHLPMVYFRGLADDLPLMEWLQKYIWPAESKWLSGEFVYDATIHAVAEMIKSGTVCANDMYFFSKSIAKAIEDANFKGVVGLGVLDFPTKFAQNADEYINKAGDFLDEFKGSRFITTALCPHAPYTVNPENYKKCIDFAERNGITIHTHLAETEWEIEEIKSKYGKPPVQLFDEIGMFDTDAVFAHCTHLTEEEIELLGRKKVNVSHCPESNMKLASGFAPMYQLYKAGTNITIGTDGAASNNDLDMLSELSTMAKIHKALNRDATVFDAESVLNMATRNAAKSLQLRNMGELKEGNCADFFVMNLDDINTLPVYNPVSHLIYSANPENITDLFINGRQLMENGKLTFIDQQAIKDKARYWQKKVNKC